MKPKDKTNRRVKKRSKVSGEHDAVREKLSGTNANSSPPEPGLRRPADLLAFLNIIPPDPGVGGRFWYGTLGLTWHTSECTITCHNNMSLSLYLQSCCSSVLFRDHIFIKSIIIKTCRPLSAVGCCFSIRPSWPFCINAI